MSSVKDLFSVWSKEEEKLYDKIRNNKDIKILLQDRLIKDIYKIFRLELKNNKKLQASILKDAKAEEKSDEDTANGYLDELNSKGGKQKWIPGNANCAWVWSAAARAPSSVACTAW